MSHVSWEMGMYKLLAYLLASSYIYSQSENLITRCSSFPFFLVELWSPILAPGFWIKLGKP